MQFRYFLAATAMLFAAVAPSAHADTVQLFGDAGFMEGSQSFVQPLDITQSGTLTISLSSVPWLDTISDLRFVVTTASKVVGVVATGNAESVQVGPGTIYAHWFGDANGKYGVGAFSVKFTFQPGVVSAVPLPGSLALLLSGLGLFFVARWRPLAASLVATVWAWSLPKGSADD